VTGSLPTMSIVMSGYIRLQVLASPETQALFALAFPAMKERPDRLGYVCQEAGAMAQGAVEALRDYLARSPGLRAPDGEVGLSYATIGDKLYYIYQLRVHTA
jgi:hypothetical protein